jgi:capsular polysaccharide biosynthesis protein
MDIKLSLGFWRGSLWERALARWTAVGNGYRYLVSEKPLGDDIELLRDYDEEFKYSSLPPVSTAFSGFKASQSKKVFRARNVTLDLISGYAFDARRRFLADTSSYNVAHSFLRFPARPHRPRRKAILAAGSDYAYLTAEAYYHWLIEDVPAYLQAKAASPTAVTLVRRNPPARVRSLLALLGESFVEAPLNVLMPSFVFASKGASLVPNPVDVATLHSFRDSLTLPSSHVRKLYISRRTDGRFPDNETHVESLLKSNGFDIVNLTGMPLDAQMALFANADVVVGTHGAGLANLVWCREGETKVVEIMRWGQPDCFEHLARIADLEYVRIEASAEGEWLVDIEALQSSLD